jgi:hypothetical protein
MEIFMKTKTFAFLFLGLMMLMTSCKKDDDKKTNEELILGKWSIVTDAVSGKRNGVSFSSTDTGTSSDYVNFGSDGKITGIQDGDTLSATYSINGNILISVTSHYDFNKNVTVSDTSQSTILSLTDNSLVIYRKDYTDANNYDEETATLKR